MLVRGDIFDFSLVMINSILGTKIMTSKRKKELNLGLDMNNVTMELTRNFVLIWPDLNILSSALLTTKYSILHKIAIANWMQRLHISTISKDLDVLLCAIGTNVSFDMANVIFQVIVSYAEAKTTVDGLPLPSLIHEVLTVQKDGLAEDDDLEMP